MTLFKLYGIEHCDAMRVDDRLPEAFLSVRLPQMRDKVAERRNQRDPA